MYSDIDFLKNWLIETSIPFWSKKGTDLINGGFFESIDKSGEPIQATRRSMLVARQIYSFCLLQNKTEITNYDYIVQHGLNFLEKNLINNGQLYFSINIKTKEIDKTHDTYAYSFALLAFSELAKQSKYFSKAIKLANQLINKLTTNWKHNKLGFLEDRKISPYLRSNTHMHLLEAFLAWEDISYEMNNIWKILSDEIVILSSKKLINKDKGFISEFFDQNWNVTNERKNQIVEPGHQFEWGWLLMRYGLNRRNKLIQKYALKLIQLGEEYGVDKSRNIAINSLNIDLSKRDLSAKLWPQTERIKAWKIITDNSELIHFDKKQSQLNLEKALISIKRYLNFPINGLWHEIMLEDNTFSSNEARASTLYHITLAIIQLMNHEMNK